VIFARNSSRVNAVYDCICKDFIHFRGFSDSQERFLKNCAICKLQREDIISHYHQKHGIQVDEENLNFENENTFQDWKKEIERQSVCKFVLLKGKTKYSENYTCHRNGYFKPRGTGIRYLKTQGTKKINAYCLAAIKVRKENNQFHVKYTKTHVGHDNEICHIDLSPTKKAEIACKLANRIPPSAILDEVRSTYKTDCVERVHLLTYKDILNICEEFKISKDYKKHQNDAISVDLKVEELKQSAKSCVLYYKPQDIIDETNPFLNRNDFVLILMNEAQIEYFKILVPISFLSMALMELVKIFSSSLFSYSMTYVKVSLAHF